MRHHWLFTFIYITIILPSDGWLQKLFQFSSPKSTIKSTTIPSISTVDKQSKFNFPSLPWSFPTLSRPDRRNLKLLFLLGLISIETSSEIFVRIPQAVLYGSTPTPIIRDNLRDISIIFPGANGPDMYTDTLATSIRTNDIKNNINRDVYVYDWLKWRGNFIRASFDGQAVGRTVCSQLARDEINSGSNIKHVQAIGISVGAFAADSCIKAYNREIRPETVPPGSTRLTLLDPFTSKGIFGYGWGLTHFGKTATVVEDYLNRDDPVPTTSDPLQLAYTIDVTESESKNSLFPKDESTHSWPVMYLATHWTTETNGKGELVFPTQEAEPQGAIVIAP
eukprot:gene11277-15129_t